MPPPFREGGEHQFGRSVGLHAHDGALTVAGQCRICTGLPHVRLFLAACEEESTQTIAIQVSKVQQNFRGNLNLPRLKTSITQNRVSGISPGGGEFVIPNAVRNLVGGERDPSLRSG